MTNMDLVVIKFLQYQKPVDLTNEALDRRQVVLWNGNTMKQLFENEKKSKTLACRNSDKSQDIDGPDKIPAQFRRSSDVFSSHTG